MNERSYVCVEFSEDISLRYREFHEIINQLERIMKKYPADHIFEYISDTEDSHIEGGWIKEQYSVTRLETDEEMALRLSDNKTRDRARKIQQIDNLQKQIDQLKSELDNG